MMDIEEKSKTVFRLREFGSLGLQILEVSPFFFRGLI